MSIYHLAILSLAFFGSVVSGQDKWSWTKTKNQKILGYYPTANKKVYYAEAPYARADRDRDREPTTKRPLPGEVANDEIEDYNDDNEQPPTRQNSPYLPGDTNYPGATQPGFAAQDGYGGGFNQQYPQFAGAGGGVGGGGGGGAAPGYPSPGILVGPGGPTGIIGRPQVPHIPQYPSPYPGQVGYPGYPAYNTQNFLGPANPIYGGAAQYPAAPQYPNTQQQFAAGSQYPIGPSSQYPAASPALLPHQFTEGYGLSTYPQPGVYQPSPQQNFHGYAGYGFEEYTPQLRVKSANVKNKYEKKIDDKLEKKLKNT
uniref:Uncharacterized protein n=1 Tax=Stomoxys calcitrans TaxID=35570 RepID=A0A1I8PAM4_STOCA